MSEAALDRVAQRREEFLAFRRHNEDRRLCGITTKHHVGAKTLLDAGARDEFGPASAGLGGPRRQVVVNLGARLAAGYAGSLAGG